MLNVFSRGPVLANRPIRLHWVPPMNEHEQAALSSRWHLLARRVVWKVNLGWWMDRLTPLLVGVGVLGFATIFWLRSRGVVLGLSQAWPWLLGALVATLATAYLLARGKFITKAEALIRLESQLHLHNALTVATLGRGAWPALPAQQVADDGWRWRWSHVGGPFAACLACLAAALYLPLMAEIVTAPPVEEPQALKQAEEWLKKLVEEKIIPPEAAEDEAAKIAALRDQPKEKWFSHESLNASDTLKEQLQRDIGNLGKNLETAERSLNALQNYADKLSQAAKDQLLKEFAEALSGLKNSPLEIDPNLLKELSQIDPNNLKGMSKEQLDQLRESLKNKAGTAGGMGEGSGKGKGPGFLGDGEGEDDALSDLLGKMGQGEGGEGEGQDGDGPGKGGISRGPGTAPLTLSDEKNDLGTDKKEGVSSDDYSRAQLGTVLGIKDGKHEVDKTYKGPVAAGDVKNAGQGGEQVWRESLTPEEKAVLKRVFQ